MRPTIAFFAYLLGLRRAHTELTHAETRLLLRLAADAQTVVEVGVDEGATSCALRAVMRPEAQLFLVDPYERGLRIERLLGFSCSEHIAHRQLREGELTCFVRTRSPAAVTALPAAVLADLIFIDADHAYDSVLADFLAWSARLAPDGLLAFHDSRPYAGRPNLTSSTGPVRLMREVAQGLHGDWTLTAECDSLSVLARASTAARPNLGPSLRSSRASDPLRVLTLSNCPDDRALGSGYVVDGYANQLRRAGHHVRLIGSSKMAPGAFLTGKRAFRYRLALGMAWTAHRAVRKEAYDIVEIYGGDAWLAIWVLQKKARRPFVIVARSNGLETHVSAVLQPSEPKARQLSHDRLFAIGYRLADGLITVSDWDRRWGLQAGYQSESHLAAIDNPLPDSYIGVPFEPERQSRTIMYCGTWLPRKGVGLIETDIPHVLRRHSDWRLRLVGVGAFDKAAHFPSDVCSRIDVVAGADRETSLKNLYASAAVTIMPSIYDSFGLVAAEAMACGCALVASPVGFPASLQDDVECVHVRGHLAGALDDALERLLPNEASRYRIAEAGRNRVQQLRWNDARDRLIGHYRAWLAEHDARRS